MIDPVAVWHAEHARFARLLDFLEREVAAFHAGDSPDYELMRDAVHYLHHYADRFHHPREDVAFAVIVGRDPAAAPAVKRLQQEHRVIAAAGLILLQFLEQVLNDVVIERSQVEAAAATYLVYYRHHLAVEEAEILPRAAELLTARDWETVASAVTPGADPLFGDDVGARYRGLRQQIWRNSREPALH
jgi:hemerythrin-like domain-containing protein